MHLLPLRLLDMRCGKLDLKLVFLLFVDVNLECSNFKDFLSQKDVFAGSLPLATPNIQFD
jgi:hypothetical protein